MNRYYVQYGQSICKTSTLARAREEAKKLSRAVLYKIDIVSNGDVVETWTPRITASGRIAYRVTRSMPKGRRKP